MVDCGELHGEIPPRADDGTGDRYEDFPEDESEELNGGDCLRIASDLKEFGNTAFKRGDLEVAIEKYQKGLRYLAEWPAPNDDDPKGQWEQIQQLRFTLYANSALLQNKQKDYRDAVDSATKALAVEPTGDKDKAKARFRRATAKIALKDDDAALEDLKEADRLAPGDAAIVRDLEACKKRINDKKEAQKQKLKKFFG